MNPFSRPFARLPDWRARLTLWLAEIRHRPFTQGQHDCALFAAGAVRAMTGHDFAAPYRGRYRTTRGGLRVLRRAGFADHLALAAAHLPEIHPSMIVEGDLVALPTPEGPALGVVQGALAYVPGANGLALISTAAAQRAFRV